MEMSMKSRGMLPTIENQKNTDLLKFEWNFFGMTASDNVCQCSLYILPIPSVDKLFIRYMEKGVYKGFTQKFLPVLLEKYNIPPENAYMWNIYTDQDLSHENSLNKYEDRSTKGFNQMMWTKTPIQLETCLVGWNIYLIHSTVLCMGKRRIQDQM